MKEPAEASPNHLTVIVFKDRLSARSFQISLNWLSRMGWGVAALILLWVFSSLLAVKYYVKSQTVIEPRSTDLRVAAPAAATNSTAVSPVASGNPLLFRDFPARVQLRESTAISIENLQYDIRGTYLQVRFNLRYNLTDGGRQQGHFVIIARGPETLMSYPDGVLNLSTERALIAVDRGEYFSVGKFREVEATFPLPRKRATFRELLVLIFDEEDQLIRQQVLTLQAGSASLPRPVNPEPAPAEVSPPSEEAPGEAPAPAAGGTP